MLSKRKEVEKRLISTTYSEATLPTFIPFIEAREYVRSLGLKGRGDWYKYLRGEYTDRIKPPYIPNRPDSAYRATGWRGWGDWFGTGRVSPRLKERFSYEQALVYVRKRGIKSRDEYMTFWQKEKPLLLPSNPDKYYSGKGWTSWSKFLGTRNMYKIQWRPFKEARQFVRQVNLRNAREFFAWCSGKLKEKPGKPRDIPMNPHLIYKDTGWLSYGDFLGNSNTSTRKIPYLEFSAAREYVRKLRLYKKEDYENFLNEYKPGMLPVCPNVTYKNKGWRDWPDFLGYTRPKIEGWRAFEEARKFVHKLGLKKHDDWLAYCNGEFRNQPKKPEDIPSNPYSVYVDKGWQSWGDWLGSKNVRKWSPSYRSFSKARIFARKLGLNNHEEWKRYVSGKLSEKPLKPEDIPKTPDRIYRNAGWISWQDFLGVE